MPDRPFRMQWPYCKHNIAAPQYPSGGTHCARPAVAVWYFPEFSEEKWVCAEHDKKYAELFPFEFGPRKMKSDAGQN